MIKKIVAFVLSVAVGSALVLAVRAWASEPVVCTITTSGTSANTSSPTSGTCTWDYGATVLVACDQDIYIDSTATGKKGAPAPTASSADQYIGFVANRDPYPVYLNDNDKHIAVIQVTTAGTCKFMTTLRPKPWKAR